MKILKLPALSPIVDRLLSPITSFIQARKDKKAAAAILAAKQASIQADKQMIDDLVAGLPNTEMLMVRACLENQLTYINQDMDSRPSLSMVDTKMFMMKLSKCVALNLLHFRDAIGIQPMQAPASLVYSMQFKEDVGTTDGGRNTRLEIISNAVAARTHKLRARYSIEAVHDLARLHDIDIESELVSALAAECADEYAHMIVNDLIAVGEQRIVTGDTGPFISTANDNVIVTINQAASQIAQQTRRGAGNVLIMSPVALSLLQVSGQFQLTNDEYDVYKPLMLRKAGYVGRDPDHKKFTVYTSLNPQLSQDGKETIIVGYKGGVGDCDAAYILCPYIPIVPSSVVADPITFAPQMNFTTRYGLFVANGDENAMYDAKSYYRTVTFDLTKSFEMPAV